jgi:hypothetical protein
MPLSKHNANARDEVTLDTIHSIPIDRKFSKLYKYLPIARNSKVAKNARNPARSPDSPQIERLYSYHWDHSPALRPRPRWQSGDRKLAGRVRNMVAGRSAGSVSSDLPGFQRGRIDQMSKGMGLGVRFAISSFQSLVSYRT